MDSDWPGDDAEINLALNDDALGKLLDAPSQSNANLCVECDGFDKSTGKNWLYPNNLPLRSYQHSIVQAALFRNTLVVLPTGLGKTFIAAVVMYNIHRWYPHSKLIFMAPTRPLVAQQIAACQKVMPFPAEDTVELTGRLPRAKRSELWASKRVFFATPQVVQSDMMDTGDGGIQFPYMSIKLLVVDEAHRAKGRYAYTQVTDSLMARNPFFRILALSATPGRTMDDVAAVCRNLYISHLEVRSDDSIDVRQYVHKRGMRTIVVPLQDRIKEPRAQLLQIIDPYLRQLVAANVLKGARGNISRNNLLYDQKHYQDRVASGERHPEHSMIVSNFAMCISLYHAMELLERHGLRVFVNNFDSNEHGREKFVLKDPALRHVVENVRQQLGDNPLDHSTHAMTNGQVAPLPANLDFGHPKYEEARQVLLEHFDKHKESRAIVFCEYRESVMLIHRLLLQHRPLIRARCFVGQSVNAGGICALTQKEQLQIMSDFRQGVSNVLVATSIGEEGLDIGEVELIVCFDICSSNPTRFVQRIGRTGRQKRGDVVMLVTEGREQQMLKEMLAHKDETNRKLLHSHLVKSSLYTNSPRLVPPEFHPRCEQRFMEPVQAQPKTPSPKAKAGRPPKPITTVRCQDLRKYFSQSQDRFLQGEPTYKTSEASQQQLLQEAARRSDPIKNFLLDTQPPTSVEAAPVSVDSSNCNSSSSSTSSSQAMVQRLRKITRLLQASKPLLSESQRSQDLVAHLQDNQLPTALKFYLLQRNAHFVRDIHFKMMEQQQRHLPSARLNSRQQRTRRIYELLQSVCGNQLERLLQQADSSIAELTLKDLLQPLTEPRFEAACGNIFAGLQEQGLCADNYELLQEQWEQLELQRLEQTMKEQLANDSTSMYRDWQDPEDPTADQDLLQADVSVEPTQPQWTQAGHSSTPLPDRRLSPEAADSRIECSQLTANLSRLNYLMSAASTPLQPKQAKKSLLDELDEDLSTFDKLAEQQENRRLGEPAASAITASAAKPAVEITPELLDLDLNDFLDPLPEEQQLQQVEPVATPPRNLSPDLFADDSITPRKATPPAPPPAAVPAPAAAKSLAAKLAMKCAAPRTPERPSTTQAALLKSPSIFENYLQRMRGRGHLSKEAQRIHSMTSTTAAVVQEEEDSPIVRRRAAKRKVCDISSDEDAQEKELELQMVAATQLLEEEESCEEVPSTQLPMLVTPPRRKRSKFNEFILQEAEQSGSDHEENEDVERTFGAYMKDSVIVSSEDEGHNDTTTHAMYLQAMRSPVHRPGAFKMPATRRFHNESIYSQPVEAEPSQYLPCSFVVDDDSAVNEEVHDISECPLERAERILKEQRRQRRRGAPAPAAVVQSKRRRIQTISDSSDEDDVVIVK